VMVEELKTLEEKLDAIADYALGPEPKIRPEHTAKLLIQSTIIAEYWKRLTLKLLHGDATPEEIEEWRQLHPSQAGEVGQNDRSKH